jgi:archaemetzincin
VGRIYILPFEPTYEDLIRALQTGIEERFGRSCEALEPTESPQYAFNQERQQYFSPDILKEISNRAPRDSGKIIGVVAVDLYVPILTYVFGQAQLNGRAAVISLFRLRPEYHGLPACRNTLNSRALKEAIHELGHTFGLTHCSHYRCVMHLSDSLRKIDIKSDDFCDSCSTLLSAFDLD